VALVGRNGCGKTTFLKILAENTCNNDKNNKGGATTTAADLGFRYTGQITSPRDVRVSFVEQEPPMSADVTVSDALLGIVDPASKSGVGGATDAYTAVRWYRNAVENAESDPDGFAAASTAMDTYNGWDVLTKAEEVATKLRVRHLQDQTLSKLSGGERKRVALAAALVHEPDALLLDEPTNFLSLAGVQWLADLLTSDKKLTILMVTHDRAFLDEVCDRVLELENGQLYEYDGKYVDYLQGRDERYALEDAALQAAKSKYRVELEWMRRQPQARESKSKARIDAFYKLEKATKPRPRDSTLDLAESTSGSRRIGGKILSLRNVNFKFGDRIMLNDFSYDFCKGDRICLAGANGVGKTTFARILTGELEPDSGTIDVGETIVMGMYDQMGIEIKDPNETVLSFVLDRVQSRDGSTMSEAPGEARRLLQQFQFDRRRWNERVSVLSGGERRRLQMLSVFSKRPNLLIMDEPSVDCDLDTLQALEEYLQEFDGVLIIVSHDRAFADKVTDHLFVFEGDGEIKDFIGTLSEYAATLIEIENENISVKSAMASGDDDSEDKKAVYKEDRDRRNRQRNEVRNAKKRMESLEKSIERLKEKVAAVQKELDDSSEEGWSVLADLTEKLSSLTTEIDEKELEWMEVAEVVEEAEMQEV